MRDVVLAALAFVAMEPVTAATHRFVMHGPGMVLHRSHHQRAHRDRSFARSTTRSAARDPSSARSAPRDPSFARSKTRSAHTGLERNDAFPVMFAALVCLGLWLGFHAPRLADLVPIGIGITAYGAAYALVHDVYIHRRLRWFGGRTVPGLQQLAAAHGLHHELGGAPYGMLVPIVPRRLRHDDASGQRVATVPRA